jgi:hypothetical protein
MKTPVALGPLAAEGLGVRRSGLRWMRPDGHLCRSGELIALTQIRLLNRGRKAPMPFAGERTLQVALAAPMAGRLHIQDRSSAGGWLDALAVHDWDPGEVVGSIETEGGPGEAPAPVPLRRLMLAARRLTWLTDVDAGLLPGWNLQARAWWGEGDVRPTTLLSIGVCDSTGFVRGEEGGFAELFALADFPAHVVHATEHPIAPCAPILLEQLSRTPAELEAISADLLQALATSPVPPTPDDYLFAGAFLAQMSGSPFRERYDVLGAHGLSQLPGPDIILLSAAAEPGRMLRHRTLGYALQIYNYNLTAAGPALRSWLQNTFEPVTRSPLEVRRDLERLIDEVHAETGARFAIVNRMSSSGRETIGNYAAFDAPLEATLPSVAAKSINLMLHDMARTRPVSIIDVDALAAEFGAGSHLPDGLHQSGALQDALRRELLALLEPRRQSTRNSMAMAAS